MVKFFFEAGIAMFTCLRDGNYVLPLQHRRHGICLNGCWYIILAQRNILQHDWVETRMLELCQDVNGCVAFTARDFNDTFRAGFTFLVLSNETSIPVIL